jgi:serine phosphatase RsbU (regulator of sigma subunit)
VAERTHELEVANIEIEAQRDMATHQRDQIQQQKKEIDDSINYAQRIQQSLLPTGEFLDNLLPEHFIIFKPRDVVSGDFYWAGRYQDKVVITAADCTGHGVPGAFMSMLGIAFLNEIVNNQARINASDILNRLREQIIRELGQTGGEGESKDGMDMSLCMLDVKSRKLDFAGANNPLYLIRGNELSETRGDKMPVAIHERMTPFSNHSVSLQKGDCLYMFSDGYQDQFGGPSGKKFMAKRFKELLISISSRTMTDQKQLLEKAMNEWIGEYDQIDDMVVIGIRV